MTTTTTMATIVQLRLPLLPSYFTLFRSVDCIRPLIISSTWKRRRKLSHFPRHKQRFFHSFLLNRREKGRKGRRKGTEAGRRLFFFINTNMYTTVAAVQRRQCCCKRSKRKDACPYFPYCCYASSVRLCVPTSLKKGSGEFFFFSSLLTERNDGNIVKKRERMRRRRRRRMPRRRLKPPRQSTVDRQLNTVLYCTVDCTAVYHWKLLLVFFLFFALCAFYFSLFSEIAEMMMIFIRRSKGVLWIVRPFMAVASPLVNAQTTLLMIAMVMVRRRGEEKRQRRPCLSKYWFTFLVASVIVPLLFSCLRAFVCLVLSPLCNAMTHARPTVVVFRLLFSFV